MLKNTKPAKCYHFTGSFPYFTSIFSIFSLLLRLFHGAEECLGATELQEEVEAYGDMTIIVGDEEADDLLVLAILLLYI